MRNRPLPSFESSTTRMDVLHTSPYATFTAILSGGGILCRAPSSRLCIALYGARLRIVQANNPAPEATTRVAPYRPAKPTSAENA